MENITKLETKFIEENRKAFAENPEIPFCASGWLWFNENDKIFRKHIIPFAENFKGKVFLSPYLVFYNFVGMNSIVFNKYKTLTNFFAMLDYLERAKTRQNVEVFMMKFLEAKYGASYFIYDVLVMKFYTFFFISYKTFKLFEFELYTQCLSNKSFTPKLPSTSNK